jgi:hypothetical protein
MSQISKFQVSNIKLIGAYDIVHLLDFRHYYSHPNVLNGFTVNHLDFDDAVSSPSAAWAFPGVNPLEGVLHPSSDPVLVDPEVSRHTAVAH